MEVKLSDLLSKRSAKPKQQFSPSNPISAAKYHLATDNGTGNMIIVANSSVKRFGNDGIMTLNDGRTIELIVSGKISYLGKVK